MPSTGVVDVHRSYITSKPGDQGNGWWVSEAAANALTAHEQKHVARAKEVYDRILEPMTVKIADSATYGREKDYWGSKAKAAVKAHIDWANTIKRFKAEDQAENAPNNRVDNEDVGAPHYPVPMKDPRTIEGKQYEHWEVMPGEKPPPAEQQAPAKGVDQRTRREVPSGTVRAAAGGRWWPWRTALEVQP